MQRWRPLQAAPLRRRWLLERLRGLVPLLERLLTLLLLLLLQSAARGVDRLRRLVLPGWPLQGPRLAACC